MKKLLMMLLTYLILISFYSITVYADEYTYDDNGRDIEVVHDDGTVTNYVYDDNGNIISVNTVSSKEQVKTTKETTESEVTTEDGLSTTEEPITDTSITTEATTMYDENTNDVDKQKIDKSNESIDNDIGKKGVASKTSDDTVIIWAFCLLMISLFGLYYIRYLKSRR